MGGCAVEPGDADVGAGGATSGASTTSTGSGTGSGGGPIEKQVVVEKCENPPTATPGDDVCKVTAGDARRLVVGDILTPWHVYQQGGVLIDDEGMITCVGCGCAAMAAGATTIVCPDAVVSPGLVNAHDHVGWMNGKPWVAAAHGIDPALRWEQRHDWRIGKRGNPRIDEDGGSASTADKIIGELRFALGGGTAIFGSGDLGGILRDLDSTGNGNNGLMHLGSKYSTFPLGDTNGTQLTKDCGSYKPEAPWSSSLLCEAPHVAEGIDSVARNEFLCLTGKGAGAVNLLDKRAALIHGVGLGPNEIATMAKVHMRLIWSPRSNVALYGDTASVTLYKNMGIAIGLGTDWLPSGSMNMLRELRCAASLDDTFYGGAIGEHDLWMMATLGSARALAFDDVLGVLAPKHAGDVAVFRNRPGRKQYAAVVRAGVEDMALVLRGGKPLAGNRNVVTALEMGCDQIDVCGVKKAVCVSRDTGQVLTQVQGSATGKYPLFFCGDPMDEPSCLPSRTLDKDKVDGSSLYTGKSTADDKDADGIADASDNCPTVFNPVRPVDGGKQADLDGDGFGDACDKCPLDKSAACTAPDPYDTDGNGTPDWQK
jgi:large repetitive protein